MKLSSTLFPLTEKTNGTSSQKLSKLSYNYLNTLSRPRILQIKKDGEIMVFYLFLFFFLEKYFYREKPQENFKRFGYQ